MNELYIMRNLNALLLRIERGKHTAEDWKNLLNYIQHLEEAARNYRLICEQAASALAVGSSKPGVIEVSVGIKSWDNRPRSMR